MKSPCTMFILKKRRERAKNAVEMNILTKNALKFLCHLPKTKKNKKNSKKVLTKGEKRDILTKLPLSEGAWTLKIEQH